MTLCGAFWFGEPAGLVGQAVSPAIVRWQNDVAYSLLDVIRMAQAGETACPTKIQGCRNAAF